MQSCRKCCASAEISEVLSAGFIFIKFLATPLICMVFLKQFIAQRLSKYLNFTILALSKSTYIHGFSLLTNVVSPSSGYRMARMLHWEYFWSLLQIISLVLSIFQVAFFFNIDFKGFCPFPGLCLSIVSFISASFAISCNT